eukprot:CAMPEP_0181228184 /NCGR_PEP_ID=MMETSP1096-20121128/33213_1 /TAXON_ID=156174 ORGANISM="Chrysochromulina ericina, Strain CCMP281" /NCGR_SAMPLE_ID=MMETSP1096 /ASSEMBLY_ACC=CAM_ASM_000453 /LENGTH=170 /DNA_ID=CAMNT_0023321693 /DNA_START=115 /DNA_END=627 /DNA_ORIENTATION=+
MPQCSNTLPQLQEMLVRQYRIQHPHRVGLRVHMRTEGGERHLTRMVHLARLPDLRLYPSGFYAPPLPNVGGAGRLLVPVGQRHPGRRQKITEGTPLDDGEEGQRGHPQVLATRDDRHTACRHRLEQSTGGGRVSRRHKAHRAMPHRLLRRVEEWPQPTCVVTDAEGGTHI